MGTNDQLFRAILNGKAVLFSGSGANVDVKDYRGNPLVTGKALATRLYKECGIENPENPYDLQDASELLREQKGEDELIAVIRDTFRIGEVGEAARKLYNLPWQRVYTTNYDEVPLAATADTKRIKPVTINSPDYRKWVCDSNICVYVNGYIGSLDKSTLGSEFKLTVTSYMSQDELLNSKWSPILSDDLEMAEAVVFVGLSLDYDLELQKIVFQNIRAKTYFVEREGISEEKKRKMGRFGTVLDIGLAHFLAELEEYERTKYEPLLEKTERFYCFEKAHMRRAYDKFATKSDVYNLFMLGNMSDSLFRKNNGKYENLVFRSKVRDVLDAISEKKKVIFIHGNLGSGKTTFIEILKQHLVKDIPVYTFVTSRSGREREEVKLIMADEGRKVIVFENYFNHLNILKLFSSYNLQDVTFILSARSTIYDSKLDVVDEYFDLAEGESTVVNLNKLDANELRQCYKIIDSNKFWGDYAQKSPQEKRAILKRDKEMQNILIDIIHSSDMRKRITDIVSKIQKESQDYYENLVLILVARVMSLELSVSDVNKILGKTIMDDARYRNNEAVKELVDFSTEGEADYKVKSSIIAKAIIEDLKCDADIIDVLFKIAKYADRYQDLEKYESILQNIASYSHVNAFLTERRNHIGFVREYYDQMSRSISYYEKNTFFWLQYSIACMKYGEYDLSQTFLDYAYSVFVEVSGASPFQCDNQQARLYLERIKKRKSENVPDDLKKAKELIEKPRVSKKDREESVVRLLFYFVDKQFIANVQTAESMALYRECCQNGYTMVKQYLTRLPNENDRRRYENLRDGLLRYSVPVQSDGSAYH